MELVIIQGDSQLIINQVNGICEAKEDQMKKYLNKVKQLIKKFKEANFAQLKKRRKHGSRYFGKSSFSKGTGGAMDEYDRVPIHAEHRYSRGTANWRIRKLDDSNSPLSQGQKASRG